MSSSTPWTVGRLLQWTADYLKNHGADSPRLDAEVLLAASLNCQRIALYTQFDEEPPETARTQFREWVRRRAEGTPVAYLVGHREFYSLSFEVGPDVLIPRPETELLVITLLDLAKTYSPVASLSIADVGTGSGIIGICAAKHLPRSRVTALDISPKALAVAERNAKKHSVADRIDFLQSDLFAALPPEQTFDFIASNPPYISEKEMSELPRDVRDYEPKMALEAGPEGTDVIERLIPEAAKRLQPGGYLLIEISPMIRSLVESLIEKEAELQLLPTIKDLARHPRVIQARKK